MKKIISVVGSTASGKTSFALKIATQVLDLKNNSGTPKYFGVDLISVDSRQIYKGLETLSGADIPDNFELVEIRSVDDLEKLTTSKKISTNFPFFKHENSKINLHGVSIINLDQEWSVAHFKDFATTIILESFKNNRLPILVGGTGLYHQNLFNIDHNLYVPPNNELREKAKSFSVKELQDWLKEVNPTKLKQMNNSDINNPRRLVRAIEISVGSPELESDISLPKETQVHTIGLELDLDSLQTKIKLRVDDRFNNGVVEEVKNVLEKCKTKDMPVCSTLGVSDISKFINGEFTQEECKENWALHEFQYAKRQLTWFKKQSEPIQDSNSAIIWLDSKQKKQYTFIDEKTFL